MALSITASEVNEIGQGVWALDLPPHQIRLFGGSPQSIGSRSVVLLHECKFDKEKRTITFDMSDVVALNVGTTSEAIALAGSPNGALKSSRRVEENTIQIPYGPGDREFISMAGKLFELDMQKAAEALLSGVRKRISGDLKRGKSKNFSETPDNFWYVIVQPRVQQLSITVRGTVDHFASMAKLPIKDDRGNTLFKVSGEGDVEAALELIFHAKRK
ncbi:hypothetical protein V9K92_06335 [Phyllobacterium sp. CCNWLW109]|uniref:hypothetical protein n=1 Tax=Phyllobacterium sp. CCNWLW109 TaxID=3127479 RepID=UPI0030785A50